MAATLYAVCPLAAQHGHFATVDVPATFWVTAALVAALTSRRWLLIGILAGLAAATKYNAGLVLLAGVAAWTLSEKRALSGLLLLLAGAGLEAFAQEQHKEHQKTEKRELRDLYTTTGDKP